MSYVLCGTSGDEAALRFCSCAEHESPQEVLEEDFWVPAEVYERYIQEASRHFSAAET